VSSQARKKIKPWSIRLIPLPSVLKKLSAKTVETKQAIITQDENLQELTKHHIKNNAKARAKPVKTGSIFPIGLIKNAPEDVCVLI
jgi:hypothetical protein